MIPTARPAGGVAELERRPSRPAGYELENRVLSVLIQELARPWDEFRHKLAKAALDMCRAQSAGIGVIEGENGAMKVRWEALAGRLSFAALPDVSLGRRPSVDWRAPVLLEGSILGRLPEPVSEALVVPFGAEGKPAGAIWVMAHDGSGALDSEDLRLLTSLARFASAHYAVSSAALFGERERSFRAMLDALPAAVYATDAEGRVTYFNSTTVEFSGRAPELGSDRWCVSWKLYNPDGSPLPHSECPMAILLKEGRIIRGAEIILERPDGRRLWIMPYPTPLRDSKGKIAGAVNMLVDITERKRAEEAQARLAAIVDSSDDAIVGKTPDGVITSWNRGAQNIFGYTEEEVKGKHISIIIPEDRLAEEHEVLARLRQGQKIDHFETERRAKDGRIVRVSLSISPIRDSKGRIIGAAKVARDITERKRVEEQIRQSQKLESIGLLAGGIAHDFNNLLTGVMGNASLALEMLEPDHPVRELLNDLMRASESAAHLTQQMLAYAGKGQFFIQPFDVSLLVSEITSLIQSSIPRTVQLRQDLDPHLPSVEADRAQLQQLIMNLVINGAEAIGENQVGVVRITTGIEDVDQEYLQDFHEAQLTPGRYVSLIVHDTGCGMDDETKSRIFDPFFTTKFMGRGLGLAAALGIVRSHKGAIRVASAPGMGSTFQVLLPIMPGSAERPRPTVRQTPVSTSKGTILLIDDEEIVRRTANTALQRAGFVVITAANGREGVDIFEKRVDEISAVLLDLTMPVMAAEETLERLLAIRPRVPVILTSGYNQQDAVGRFPASSLAGFIQKPFTASELIRKIQAVVEKT